MNDHIKELSIKRVYAERIFTGEKTIELRKRDIGIYPGMLILLYEVVPDSCIRGGFILHRTKCLPKDTMWQQYHSFDGRI
jgi:predicted transcriptional regulator